MVDATGKKRDLTKGWYSVQGLAWASKTEVWFTGTKTGVARALFAVSLAGAERLVARIPGTLTLHDVSPNGRVLLARDTWRRELMGMRADEAKERNLSWQDYSYPAELSDDGADPPVRRGRRSRRLQLRGVHPEDRRLGGRETGPGARRGAVARRQVGHLADDDRAQSSSCCCRPGPATRSR